MNNEFDVINRFFNRADEQRDRSSHIILGIGDDAAVLRPPAGHNLVFTVDTLVSGVHFSEHTAACDVGYKALAVNLSDLAAMGAKPAWVLLSLTMPKIDETWLEGFSNGFFELIDVYGLALVGGDTTRGPLAISCQVVGLLPEDKGCGLSRAGAAEGDLIFVTGALGGAGIGLKSLAGELHLAEGDKATVLACLDRPVPRVKEGLALSTIATAAVDVSDGLMADLGHICEQSHVGAALYAECIPIHPVVDKNLPQLEALELAMTAGDDYELCFTAPQKARDAVFSYLATLNCSCHCIGKITQAHTGVIVYDPLKKPIKTFVRKGYTHYEDT